MTIEEMTTVSYVLLVIAVILGIVTVVLFFTLKIPKAYRAVKGHKHSKRKHGERAKPCVTKERAKKKKSNYATIKLEEAGHRKSIEDKTEVIRDKEIKFTILQDITFVHAKQR